MFVYSENIQQTITDIVRLPSTSGHEEHIRNYIEKQLLKLGLEVQIEKSGNLIATLSGKGEPLLLCAHMDRVAPGLGHEPVLDDGILYSNGKTNLGADDAAGITVILEVLRRTVEQKLEHPPIVALFTVQEECGLCGAREFDSKKWKVKHGIVFDNAFDAGVVVSEGAIYENIDIVLTGKSGHPGKDLTGTASAIEIFRKADIPVGIMPGDLTRINIGQVRGGEARNAIPATMYIEGELRSFAPEEERERYRQALRQGLEEAASKVGGQAKVTFTPSNRSYAIRPDEPLLLTYQSVLAQRGANLQLQPTFIGSDTNALRPEVKAFTISTGVVGEHTVEEHVALAPLEQLVNDTLGILYMWQKRGQEAQAGK